MIGQFHFQIPAHGVATIADLLQRPGDFGVDRFSIFLQDTKGLLGSRGGGCHDMAQIGPVIFARFAQFGAHVAIAVTGLQQHLPGQTADCCGQIMSQRFDIGGQAGIVQNEAGVFFQGAQTLTRSIRAGIENTIGRL